MVAKMHSFVARWHEGSNLQRHRYDAARLNRVIDSLVDGTELGIITREQYATVRAGGERRPSS